MWKEGPQVDCMFRLIKRVTPVIVILYILFCCIVIRRSSQSMHNKSGSSLFLNGSLAVQQEGKYAEQKK
ncbi:MAG: hypothetical protein INR73_13310 [Williamsia sp.]|nr:hypothetical protein [Williamsia sp.]